MKLTTLQLGDFRCFHETTITFDERLTVFVGGNAAGKSTILDAIALLLWPILNRFPFDKKHKGHSIVPSDIRQTDQNDRAPFAFLQATATANGNLFTWDRTKLRDQSRVTKLVTEYLELNKKELRELYAYVDQLTDAHNQKSSYNLPIFAHYGTNRAVDVPHNRLRRKGWRQNYFKRLAGLENALEPKNDFRRAVAQFDFLERRELREIQYRPEVASTLPALNAVREAIQRTIPNVERPRIDSETGRFVVDSIDPGGASIRLYLDELSDGFQIVLGVVMDFALRMAFASPDNSTAEDILNNEAILMIDEIDLHLHPSWQQRVIGDVQAAFPRTQLIITTHSPQVLSTVNKDSIRIIQSSEKGPRITIPEFQTRGVQSADVLFEIMGVDPVPRVEEAKLLDAYRALIDEGQHRSEDGINLRSKLTAHFGESHPLIRDCDRLTRFQEFKLSKTQKGLA